LQNCYLSKREGTALSTKSTIALDEKGDSFHLYEELMDGKVWLRVEVDEMEARRPPAGRRLVLSFPVPEAVLDQLFRAKYGKRPPAKRASKAEFDRLLTQLQGAARKARVRRLGGEPRGSGRR
jgi:hypothetical protein